MAIDIQSILNELGVPYYTYGKNVSEGWVTISCPLCGDRSNHGGFSPEGTGYSCFICGKHSITNILTQFAPYAEVKKLLNEFGSIYFTPKEHDSKRASLVEWPPKEASTKLPSIHAQYLTERNFSPMDIQGLFGVMACYYTGIMKYRLVIPVFQNGKVVTYVGRDVTGKSPLKYKNLKEELSILPAKECVYNIDAVHETALIVEGPTDAWRFRSHAVSLFGLQFTISQVNQLAKLKNAIICFDTEVKAKEKAYELGEALSFRGVNVSILSIDASDPGELSQKEADEIKDYALSGVSD